MQVTLSFFLNFPFKGSVEAFRIDTTVSSGPVKEVKKTIVQEAPATKTEERTLEGKKKAYYFINIRLKCAVMIHPYFCLLTSNTLTISILTCTGLLQMNQTHRKTCTKLIATCTPSCFSLVIHAVVIVFWDRYWMLIHTWLFLTNRWLFPDGDRV